MNVSMPILSIHVHEALIVYPSTLALVWLTRFKGQLVIMKGVRLFVTVHISAISSQKPESAYCDLIRVLHSESVGLKYGKQLFRVSIEDWKLMRVALQTR